MATNNVASLTIPASQLQEVATNLRVGVFGKKLVIVIETDIETGDSQSGKTVFCANSGGWIPLPANLRGSIMVGKRIVGR